MQDTTTSQQTTHKGPLGSLLASLTQTASTLMAMAQTRLELLTSELQEEIQQGARLLLWGVVAVLAGLIGLFLAALVVIFIFWDTHRVLAAVSMTAIFFAIAIGAALHLRNMVRNRPRMLEGTLSELARDRQRLEERVSG